MRTTVLATVVVTYASITSAQNQYTIDPDTVTISTRNAWCVAQTSQCPPICLQYPGVFAANENQCNPTTLTYTCVCSNGLSPNVSEYSQTIPYFTCTEWGRQCVVNCGSNSACASDCLEDHPCGAQNPTRVNLTTISASATASQTGVSPGASTAAYTGPPVGGATGAAGRVQPLALDLGHSFGVPLVIGALFAGFALLL